MPMTTTQQTDAYRFFAIAFSAAPGVEYMNQIAAAYEGGATTKQIVNEFTKKSVFTNVYPNFLTNESFASRLIENVVGSSATDAAKTEAKADVVSALNGGATRGDVIFQVFSNLAGLTGDAKWGNVAQKMANQVATSQYYTETLLKTSTDIATLQAVLAGVDHTTSVTTAALDARLNPPAAGQTYTLTTGTDTVTGTAGNDTINAPLAGANSTTVTYSAIDQINGGAGTDTIYIETNSTDVNLATQTSLEVIRINAAGANSAVTLANDKAYTSLESINSTKDVTFNSIKNAGVKGAMTSTATGTTTTFNYDSTTLSGAADTLAVTLNGASGGLAITGGTATNALETVSLAVASNSTLALGLNLGAASTTKLVVTGAGNLNLGAITDTANVLKTIDASAMTGNLTVTGTAAGDSITGGSGNDSLTGAAGNDVILGGAGADTLSGGASGNDSIDGGDGDDKVSVAGLNKDDTVVGGAGTDTLVLNAGIAHDADSTEVQVGTRISGFEVIEAVSGAAAVVATGLNAGNTITKVVSNGGNLSMTKDTAVTSIEYVQGGNTVSIESAGAQSVNIKGAAATPATAITAGTLTTKATSLTVTSSNVLGTSAVNYLPLSSTNATVTSVTLTGSNNIKFTGGTAVTSVNASGVTATGDDSTYAVEVSVGSSTSTANVTFTPGTGRVNVTAGGGSDTLTGTAGADSISGGNGNNVITAGAGADTVNSGTGNDVISLGDGNDVVTDSGDGADSIVGGAGDDTVTTANAGNDTLDGGDGNDNLTGGDGNDSILGGAGTDTLSDGDGNDTVLGGDGADTITMGAGIDSIDAGAGNDRINSANTVGSGDTINGGDGTDTLAITGVSGTARPTLTSIETINLTFGGTGNFGVKNVTDSSAKTFTVDASAAANVTLSDLVTGSTVNISDDSTYLGTDADTTGDIGTVAIDMADNSSASLTLNVNAKNNSAAGVQASAFGGVTITDAGDVSINSGGGTTSNRVVNDLGGLVLNADVTALTVKAAANSGLTTGAVTWGTTAGVQTVTLTGAATSTLTLTSMANASSVKTLVATAAGSSSKTEIGNFGTGTGAVLTSISGTATGGGTVDFTGDLTSTAALETLSLSATDRGSIVDFSGKTITVGSVSKSASITANANTTVTPGTLVINGATKALTVTVGADATLGGMTVTGTSAIEKVTYDINANAAKVSNQNFGATKITELSITAGGAGAYVFNNAASGDLTLDGNAVFTTTDATSADIDLQVATKGTLNFAGATGTVSIDLSDMNSLVGTTTPSTGAWALTGGSGDDTITGGSGADTITGNAGNDSLTGGLEADSITGGDGADAVLGGDGADTLNGDAGNDTITGGEGADVINVGTGIDTIVMVGATDTQSGAAVATGFIYSGDVVTGMSNGDKIDLSNIASLTLADGAIAVSGTTFATATANLVTIVRGSYNTSTKAFTAGTATADNDYLIQYNGGTSGTTVNNLLLVDIVGTVTASATGEVITLGITGG